MPEFIRAAQPFRQGRRITIMRVGNHGDAHQGDVDEIVREEQTISRMHSATRNAPPIRFSSPMSPLAYTRNYEARRSYERERVEAQRKDQRFESLVAASASEWTTFSSAFHPLAVPRSHQRLFHRNRMNIASTLIQELAALRCTEPRSSPACFLLHETPPPPHAAPRSRHYFNCLGVRRPLRRSLPQTHTQRSVLRRRRNVRRLEQGRPARRHLRPVLVGGTRLQEAARVLSRAAVRSA